MRAGCASEESPLNHPGILRVSDNAGIAISQTYGVAVDAAGTPPLAPLAPARRAPNYTPMGMLQSQRAPSRARGSGPRPGGGGPKSRRHHEPRQDVDSASGGLLAGL